MIANLPRSTPQALQARTTKRSSKSRSSETRSSKTRSSKTEDTGSTRTAAGRDRELTRRIKAGDDDAFGELYELYGRRVYSYSLKRLRNVQEAEDATQEVFLQIHRSLHGFQERASLMSWIYGIAHNVVCQRYRRRTPIPISIDEPEAMVLSSQPNRMESTLDAGRMLDRCGDILAVEVTPDAQSLFHMRFRENQSVHHIAQQTQKSDQAVKMSLFRTRRALAGRVRGLADALSA